MPSQDRLRPRDGGDVRQRLPAELLSQLGEADPFRVRHWDPAWDLGTQDLVLCGQIFVPQQKLVVDVSANQGQRFEGFHGACLHLVGISRVIGNTTFEWRIRNPQRWDHESDVDGILSIF